MLGERQTMNRHFPAAPVERDPTKCCIGTIHADTGRVCERTDHARKTSLVCGTSEICSGNVRILEAHEPGADLPGRSVPPLPQLLAQALQESPCVTSDSHAASSPSIGVRPGPPASPVTPHWPFARDDPNHPTGWQMRLRGRYAVARASFPAWRNRCGRGRFSV